MLDRDDPEIRAYVHRFLSDRGLLACPCGDGNCDLCLLEEAEAIIAAQRDGILIDCVNAAGRTVARNDPSRYRLSTETALAALFVMEQHETKVYDEPAEAAEPHDQPEGAGPVAADDQALLPREPSMETMP